METATLPAGMYGEPDGDLYAAGMVKRVMLGVQEFRIHLRERLRLIEDQGEHTVLARRGKPVAVMVPMDWYRRAAEALDDPTEF